jgi:hypothetical protein
MFKNPFFYGERGCLWVALDCGLAIFAVICLIDGEQKMLAWSILLTDALNITVRIIGRLVNRKRYYKEDSFWLRTDDAEDHSTDA